jgi:AcrR family transcriptional regulator
VSTTVKRGRPSSAPRSSKEAPVVDIRTRRRDSRREQSQGDILDAAERVFGEDGIHGGSLRRVAEVSGFSVGALYLFFETKADLLVKTFERRGKEWDDAVQAIAAGSAAPLVRLHEVIDFVILFLSEHPQFRALLSQVSRGSLIAGFSLAAPGNEDGHLSTIMAALAGLVEEGQNRGEIRPGDPKSLAHLYSVMVNEYALLGATPGIAMLTESQFHGFVDGALRAESESIVVHE